jgi:hypothetical protein
MFPEFACNLSATLSYPPWRNDLDWGLYTTKEWEKRTTFHSYVQPGAATACLPGQVSSFPRFSTLPAELQLRVLSFCPARTLFQVMRVSSTLRTEASKLFWANPNAFFVVEAYWLLDGGYPGNTCWDMAFLHHVQQVEIEYYPGAGNTICPQEVGEISVRQDLILCFWKSFKQRFPNAKRVIINQNWETTSCWSDTEPVALPLRTLIQYCPPGINVSAFVLEKNPLIDNSTIITSKKSWQRSLYQPTADGRWETLQLDGRHTTLFMPTKQFSGPVGEFRGLAYECERIACQKYGLWPLMIEALDRHHFDGGRNESFTCPAFGCDAYFAKAGEWTVHAVKLHCQGWRAGEPMVLLPNELRAVFEEKENALEARREKIIKRYKEMFEDWNEEGGQRRRKTERGWIEQLENDAAWDTGEKARESKLWRELLQQMSPIWVGC